MLTSVAVGLLFTVAVQANWNSRRNLKLEQGVVYQADQVTKINDAIATTKRKGYTGSLYINFGDKGSYTEWNNVHASDAGTYLLRFRYAAGEDCPCRIIINRRYVREIEFPDTGGWETWKEEEITVSLERGMNTVRIVQIQDEGPNLDKMEVYPVSINPVNQYRTDTIAPGAKASLTNNLTYQANDVAIRSDAKIANTFNDYTGGSYIDFGSSGSYVEWNNVQASGAGEYMLTFRYAARDSKRACRLFVNGILFSLIPFPYTGGRDSWREEKVAVRLKNGYNTIRVQSVRQGPNVDKMTVSLLQLDTSIVHIEYQGADTDKMDIFHPRLDRDREDVICSGANKISAAPLSYTLTFQATETSIFSDATLSRRYTNYTGDSYIDFGGSRSYVEWENVDVFGAGSYILSFRYAAPDNKRACKLFVNGILFGLLSFVDSGGRDSWKEENATVALQKGLNKIRVQSIRSGPNLDRMTVSLLDLDTLIPSSSPSVSYSPTSTASNVPSFSPSISPSLLPSKFPSIPPTASPTLTFQAVETTLLNDAKISTRYRGYTGDSYVDFGGSRSYVEWDNIRASGAGDYLLSIRYAASDSRRASNLLINGMIVAKLPFADTGGWTSWKEQTVIVPLKDGNNKIRIQSVKNGPNVDRVSVVLVAHDTAGPSSSPSVSVNPTSSFQPSAKPSISPSLRPSSAPSIPPTASPTSTYHVTETARKSDAKFSTRYDGFTGDFYVDFGGSRSFIEWDNVRAPGAGKYLLSIRYSAPDSRRACRLYVNGIEATVLKFADTGDRDSWEEEKVEVTLEEGDKNTVRIEAIRNGPNVDKISVTLVSLLTPNPSSSPSDSARPTISSPPSQLPSISPSFHPSSVPSPSPTQYPSTSPSSEPTVSRTRRSFQLKLHWEKSYMWQESTARRSWCMERDGKRMLDIQECNDDTDKQRWYFNNGRIISDDDKRLCLSTERNRRGLWLYKCGYQKSNGAINQRWSGFQKFGKFQLKPKTDKTKCITQHHHPRADEILYIHNCLAAYRDRTVYWVAGYWDSHRSRGRRYKDS